MARPDRDARQESKTKLRKSLFRVTSYPNLDQQGALQLLGALPFGIHRLKNTATGAESLLIKRSPEQHSQAEVFAPFQRQRFSELVCLNPRFRFNPQLFATSPRNLATAFTHYLSERPEMTSQ